MDHLHVLALAVMVGFVYTCITVGHRRSDMPDGILYPQHLKSDSNTRLQNLGPPTLPFLGNILDIPRKNSYLKLRSPFLDLRTRSQYLLRFTQWASQYGGIYTLKIGPGTAVIITSRALVRQLLDKKSSISSNRPPLYIGNDLVSNGAHMLIMNYGKLSRAVRKAIHGGFMESVVIRNHTRVVDAEAVQMCRDFLVQPEKHMEHPKRFSNSIVMSIGRRSHPLRYLSP